MVELTRPACVDDAEWSALTTLITRINHAMDIHDYSLVLGTSKELCEAVAKVTFQQRSERFGSRTDMSDLIPGAHKLVGRLPATMEGGAPGGAVRDLAQAAMKLVNRLVELRNRAGTGHGRPEPILLDEVDARLAGGAAVLWSSWMLARLDAVVANDPDRLARSIATDTFYRGDLARKLLTAGLSTMDDRDQRVVGFAVGQRGGPGGTWNVLHEGVREAAESGDTTTWPPAYREAVAEGMLLDRNGYLSITNARITLIAELLDPLPEQGAVALAAIRERLQDAEPASFVTIEERQELIQALEETAQHSVPAVADVLRQFVAMVESDT